MQVLSLSWCNKLLTLALICTLALISVSTPVFAQSTILDMRLWQGADNFQFVFESERKLTTRSFILNEPKRLVVDIDVASNINLNRQKLQKLANSIVAQKLDASSTFIKKIRINLGKEYLRIVFDLDQKIEYSTQMVDPIGIYGYRQIITITPENPPDLLLSLINQLQDKPGTLPSETKPFYVVLDPGHGGEDPGAVSKSKKRYEKHAVLAIAKQVKKHLEINPQFRVALTRSSDVFVPLKQRLRAAHLAKADLFISIHADSVLSTKPSGSSVYVLSEKGASTKFAKRLAKHANLSDLLGSGVHTAVVDPDVDATLRSMSKEGKERASIQLALDVLAELKQVNKLHSHRVEMAGFLVLKSPSVPSILVETAFISNPQEERRLFSNDFQDKISQAIANGIIRYYQRNRP